MIDERRFLFVAEELGRSCMRFGLKANLRKIDYDDGLAMEIAKWSDTRPLISLWYGNWFLEEPNESYLWAGFQGSKARMEKLRNSILKNQIFKVDNFVDLDLIDWSISRIPKGTDSALCEFDEAFYYIGFYEQSLKSTSAVDIVNNFAGLIFRTIQSVESPEISDIAEIKKEMADGKINETTSELLIQARRGQGRFRNDLDELWHRKCAVSRCCIYQTLRASHIKPWRVAKNEERLDPENGLLLNAILDALFDKGLVSFNDDGDILVSADLPFDEREFFRLDGMKLSKIPSIKQREYLQYHRQMLVKNLEKK